ncbi:hypothetical protein B0T16DRAFT_492059 [Cercophora newfieldiana]|uniref:Uncharacterized protein n=1 Tax=Cercophora newfieldiana TaxID=92897 RepID=A0AA39YDE2_9PEZI|nr:hypothetical protein B0T16DRAFT_492059 [Cercophora newfieldiana]
MAKEISGFFLRHLQVMLWIEASFVLEPFFDASDLSQQSFKRWQNDVGEILKLDNLDSIPSDIRDCLSDLEELCGDMTELLGDWVQQLREDPSAIWGDIAIFSKSRFLASTTAGSVESLAPTLEKEQPGTITQAVKPTFSVSMCSSDATLLAVLSIFPPEGFRLGWENNLSIPCTPRDVQRGSRSPPAIVSLTDVAAGWLATYEVFSLNAVRSHSLSLNTIALGEMDVRTHLETNLRLSMLRRWKCEFPLTISPDLNSCSILDKIIYFSPGRIHQEATLPLASLLLQQQQHPVELKNLGQESRYAYQIFWSPDSLWFALVVDHISIASVTVALFSSRNIADNPELSLVSSVVGAVLWSGNVSDLQFHPSEALLLFRVHEDVYLWPFELHPGHHSITPFRSFRAAVIEFPDKAMHGWNLKLGFSHDGLHLAIYYPGRAWPSLSPLPSAYFTRGMTKRKRDQIDYDDNETPSKRPRSPAPLAGTGALAITSILNNPLQLSSEAPISAVATTCGEGNSSLTMLTTSTADKYSARRRGEISILKWHDGGESSVTLAKLPNSLPIEHASVRLGLPYNLSESLDQPVPGYSIIVTQKPVTVHESDDATMGLRLPIVLRKDARALKVEIVCSKADTGNPA